jgi:hypothetical protein
MKQLSPPRLIILGFVLLVLGFVLPFSMLLQVLPSTLLLNFVAYLSSLFGLVIGIVGLVLYTQTRRRGGD